MNILQRTGLILVACASVPGAALAATAPTIRAAFSGIPLHFEANQGQLPAGVRYAARGGDFQLLLGDDEALIQISPGACPGLPAPVAEMARDCGDVAGGAAAEGAQLRARLIGAKSAPRSVAEQPLAGRSHYLRGVDASAWQRNVAQYGRVRYEAVYPGVDLVYYGNQGQLEFDFIVAPGHDPHQIRLDYRGASRAEHLPNGDLALHTPAGALTLRRPVAYQQIDGERRAVAADFQLEQKADRIELAFALGDFDPAAALVIDPVVVFSTYLGARDSGAVDAIAVDSAGYVYAVGTVNYSDFTTFNALQPLYGGGGNYDGFIAKLSPDGSELIYATYFGGRRSDYVQSIVVDASGSAIVGGYTESPDFPPASQGSYAGGGDAFIAKLAPDGSSLLWSNLIGGATFDYGRLLALDAAGNPHLAGETGSSDFPVLRAMQPVYGGGYADGYVAKFAADTGALLWSTYIGGSGNDYQRGIAIDSLGRACLAGATTSTDFPTVNPLQAQIAGPTDAYVARLSPSGRVLQYSTYLGGSSIELAPDIAVDAQNALYIAGATNSPDFPTVNSLQPFSGPYSGYDTPQEAFVAKLRPDGAALLWSTFLGGSGYDRANAIALDAERRVHVAGYTQILNYPANLPFPEVNPVQAASDFFSDVFVATLPPNGSKLLFASQLGGDDYDSASDLAVAPGGDLLVAGRTFGDWPVVDALQPRPRDRFSEGFVTRISFAADAVPDVVEFEQERFGVREGRDFYYALIRVTRTGSGYGRVRARIATSNGSALAGADYTAQDASIAWNHGVTGIKRYLVPIASDGVAEGPETLQLNIISIDGFATIGARASSTLTIRDPLPAAE